MYSRVTLASPYVAHNHTFNARAVLFLLHSAQPDCSFPTTPAGAASHIWRHVGVKHSHMRLDPEPAGVSRALTTFVSLYAMPRSASGVIQPATVLGMQSSHGHSRRLVQNGQPRSNLKMTAHVASQVWLHVLHSHSRLACAHARVACAAMTFFSLYVMPRAASASEQPATVLPMQPSHGHSRRLPQNGQPLSLLLKMLEHVASQSCLHVRHSHHRTSLH